MTARVWSCLRSFTSVKHLNISESSLSFFPSLPELPSVTTLSAERVTSQSFEVLLSSLPGLRDMAITVDDADRDISQITAGLRRIEGQQLTQITITGSPSLPSEKKSVSSGTMNLRMFRESGTNANSTLGLHITGLLNAKKSLMDDGKLFVEKCQLSSEMTERIWSCLRSFTSLNHLTISDSSLSFLSSPPELPFVRKLSAERVTSQSYEGLLSSLPGLRNIDITIDDAERDIPQITAGLRRTERQQLTHINLKAPSSPPSEKKSVSRKTMEGLGCLIKDQTKNLEWLHLTGVKCTDDGDLVDLIECCRKVKTMSYVWLYSCGTKEGGILGSHLRELESGDLRVNVYLDHDDSDIVDEQHYRICHIG